VRQRVLVRLTREGQGVTTLELFFDLVFVFALTQMTSFMADGAGLAQRCPGAFAARLAVVGLVWPRLAG
jgi:low temperature requirement protein LtrA